MALEHGYRVLALSEATVDEWDHIEGRHALGYEKGLLDNRDSPEADEVRKTADEHRRGYLRGRRETLGFANLTLTVPR